MSSWFGTATYETWSIFKDNKPQPQIELDGPSLFSVSNDNFDGNIVITALLSFDDSCLQNEAASNLPYELVWTVDCLGCDTSSLKYTLLKEKLAQKSGHKYDVISFSADDHLEAKATYTFTVRMTCLSEGLNNYECNVANSLTMAYILSEITCQINTADQEIRSISRESFFDYNTLYLDGGTFTNDPDDPDGSGLSVMELQATGYIESGDCTDLFYDNLNSQQRTDTLRFMSILKRIWEIRLFIYIFIYIHNDCIRC